MKRALVVRREGTPGRKYSCEFVEEFFMAFMHVDAGNIVVVLLSVAGARTLPPLSLSLIHI